jgi:hypothetical protein|tara:strand:- start:97 stop:612 length:516 start_codon:yes stop_codon:yes gene_type:complete
VKIDLNNNLPINDLQLAEKLGECIHSERRSDFSLMMAMLIEDVSEHSQFKLPDIESSSLQVSEQQLRKEFDLPEKASLSIKVPHKLACFNQAQMIVNHQLLSINLENALKPQPIAFRDNNKYISSDVISNTSIHCQIKHADNVVRDKLGFNTNVWLDAIETSVAHESPFNV